jgi:hypothetical protein
MPEGKVPPPLRVWQLVRVLETPAIFVGALAAATGHRWGAYVLLTNLVVQIGSHVAVGSLAYRDVMSRPWPNVAPLDDDEWDD